MHLSVKVLEAVLALILERHVIVANHGLQMLIIHHEVRLMNHILQCLARHKGQCRHPILLKSNYSNNLTAINKIRDKR